MLEDIISLINDLLIIEYSEGISMRYITNDIVNKYNLLYVDYKDKPTEVKVNT